MAGTLVQAARQLGLLSRLPSRLALTRSLASSATAADDALESVAELKRALEEAVETAEMVRPSAEQLFLETDPAAREPRAQYELHYATMALTQLHGALDLAAHLRDSLGSEGMDELLRREKLAVVVADAQLWRDRTAAAIEGVKRRAEANEVHCP